MADYPTLISYKEALEILHTIEIAPLGTQQVHFKNALNRICAEDIVAAQNIPAYPTAAMDGYAIRYDDIDLLASSGLAVLPPNKAGNPTRPTLDAGYAIKTFTGSLMPHNADTLVIVEHIMLKNDRIFLDTTRDSVKKSQWIRQVGDNYKQGDVLLRKGDKIGAFEVGLLAELNHNFIQVYQRARVGVMCIGDEIVEVGEQSPSQSAVRSVNTHLLESLLTQMGQEPIIYPILKDDKALIRATYERALKECDMLLTTGGMSKGDYDYTQEIMQELTHIHFKGVRLKPGKPVAFGTAGKTLVLGLPGFPNSSAVTFLLFGSILLARLQHRIYTPMLFNATLLENVKRADSRMEFRACELVQHNGELGVKFSAKKSLQSSMINNLTHNTALALLAENGADLSAGSVVQIMLLNHF
ncbi:molybdopterin molybdenumtransferase MoeA [Helicobacter jaachi]|uniref:Molybdopterin molybdenumtransferase n=1 Tax=Helicobacter jaachi TaxID=1677920 RepID=A0A4U8T8Z9_9HELI|nr:molybdopterin molybdotransferase MoeA [Helicobacter jaachi]TLD96209.1 molybdopterin molybdenumtransferase MoeA [Helicobacter jaachi]